MAIQKGEKLVLQKLENFTNKDIIKEEAEILTNLLDDITKNLVRPETFDKIRQLKDLSKTQNYRELNQIVEQLTNEEMTVISRYFAILPLLINISEDVDLAYEIISVCIMISILQRRLLYHVRSQWACGLGETGTGIRL